MGYLLAIDGLALIRRRGSVRTIHDATAFIILFIIHTIISIGAYRFLTSRIESTLPRAATRAPVESATPEQRPGDGDSSRPVVQMQYVTVSISRPVELYVISGYAALALSLILALAGWLRRFSN
jgi:hypothetical protein